MWVKIGDNELEISHFFYIDEAMLICDRTPEKTQRYGLYTKYIFISGKSCMFKNEFLMFGILIKEW